MSDQIGRTVSVRGEIDGGADLTVDGRFEGVIAVPQHALTIGRRGLVEAPLLVRSVVVAGEVKGDIVATDVVSLRESACVEGNITTPRLAIAEGARYRGSIEMLSRRGIPPARPSPSANSPRAAQARMKPAALFLRAATRPAT